MGSKWLSDTSSREPENIHSLRRIYNWTKIYEFLANCGHTKKITARKTKCLLDTTWFWDLPVSTASPRVLRVVPNTLRNPQKKSSMPQNPKKLRKKGLPVDDFHLPTVKTSPPAPSPNDFGISIECRIKLVSISLFANSAKTEKIFWGEKVWIRENIEDPHQ